MGVPKGSGILDLYSETLRSTQVKEQVPKPQSRDFDMSYDDIMVLIEVKREMKNKMRERSP